MAESQCRIAELEVQLQKAKDKVAVLLGFRQSRYEGVASKGKPSSRQSFSAAKARHGASR
ncbi:hypothetical protein AAVH_09083 [Aphelenchoides avenae]|nr:hypothetical protein AAVH_09083 [Aphelenchus avenae]